MNTTTVLRPKPTPTQWRSVRHARVTRWGFSRALSIRARYIYTVLCYLLEYEKPQRVSQARIAETAEVSEGTVSLAMDELARAGRIVRVPMAEGGYELTLVRPPELREAQATVAQRDQTSDPAPERPASPPARAETPIMRDQMLDPLILHDHADLGGGGEASLSEDPIRQDPIRQDPLYQHLMQIPDMHPETARRAVKIRTGTLAEFELDVARAREMPGVDLPPYYVLSYWLTGVRLPQRAPAPPPDRSRREDRRRPGGAQARHNAPPDMGLAAQQRIRADELLGPDADDPEQRLLLYCAFDAGLDGQAAIDWMRAELGVCDG